VVLSDLFKRDDSLVVALALAVITILAWTYLIAIDAEMQTPPHVQIAVPRSRSHNTSGMKTGPGAATPDKPTKSERGAAMRGMDAKAAQGAMAMTNASAGWSATQFIFIFAMWAVMMVGMMTPSVSPMVLIYARFARGLVAQGVPFASTAWFAGGYLVAWTGFALIASFGQYALDRLALLTPMMAVTSVVVGGLLLVAAGMYQWLPIKQACLASCRAPLGFVQRHGGFRSDALGSVRLGALHGLYCIGCCWALMLLLFVAGVMNLFWIAALMFVVLAEKLLPGAFYVSRAVGAVAIAAGLWVLAN